MWTVSTWTLVILCSASVWQICEAGCRGGGGGEKKMCYTNEECPEHYACLLGDNGDDSYCQKCRCDKQDQCRRDPNGTIYCSCPSGFPDPGEYCECICHRECPSGYTLCKSDCTCHKAFSTTMGWHGAQTFCSVNDAFLVKISSSSENTCVRDLIQDSGSHWIGASDVPENDWKWTDQHVVLYENWQGGEPNNANNEDCALMYPWGRWNDQDCNAQLRFVCERYP